ncbi:hypothetical protein TRFO_11441 [Tritrichomonas foetus]|uniref:Ubiquitin-like domain-containing protein n=1 Tax=Tritrichomonas foetus TaxID=1144522 RepID=A0A1J4J5M4_9EUKA|nr:hypothetical protein TRFO_11441 [Tritrichomonas foetus]|eukprot:OHS93969.1 hypothetical protein TRFO_11441 [Tritrichomonas foetus]
MLCTNEIAKIYVYQPQMRIQHVRININKPISTLDHIYNTDKTFIYNGQILDKQKTFENYNISDGSKIVMLTDEIYKNNKSYADRWLHITRDGDIFNERIEMTTNVECKKEIARLSDLKFGKLELKPKRLLRAFSQPIAQNYGNSSSCFVHSSIENVSNSNDQNRFSIHHSNSTSLVLDFPLNCSPSTDPLPVFW